MNVGTEKQCLQFILEEWKALTPDLWPQEANRVRPWGVWIVKFNPIPSDWSMIDLGQSTVRKTWFLDEKKGLEERHQNEFARFVTEPWKALRSGGSGVNNDLFGNPHQIGMAYFAAWQGKQDIYVETIWGWLYGYGYQTKINKQGQLQVEKVLWRA